MRFVEKFVFGFSRLQMQISSGLEQKVNENSIYHRRNYFWSLEKLKNDYNHKSHLDLHDKNYNFKILIAVKAFVVTSFAVTSLCRNPLMKCAKVWSLIFLRRFFFCLIHKLIKIVFQRKFFFIILTFFSNSLKMYVFIEIRIQTNNILSAIKNL